MSDLTTNAINSKRNERIAKHEAKIKQELEAKRKEAEKQQAAIDLVNGLTNNSDESKVRKIRGDVKDTLKEQYKSGQITEEQYKEARKYLSSGEWKDQTKAQISSEARTRVAGLAGNSDGTSIGDIKDDVKSELKKQKEAGTISEAEYDQAKKYAKTGTWIGRFFGVKEKDSRKLFKTEAYRNNVEQTRANGPEFDEKLQAKMNVAGITVDDVYAIGENNGGAADGTINYSWKKKQEGEMDAIQAVFNSNNKGVEFSKKETNKIMKQAGYHVEKKVDAGQVATDVARVAVPLAPVGAVNISQAVVVKDGGLTAKATQTVKGLWVVPAAAAVGTGIASAINQAHRVEDRAIPTNIPTGVDSYDEYAKYLDTHSTAEGAQIGKDIAKFYTDKEGKLLKDQMNRDLSTAAGTDGTTTTPLNYQEALGLLTDLSSGKKKVEKPEPTPVVAPQKDTCEIALSQNTTQIEESENTDCYTVKSGDNWYAVVTGKYQPKTAADAKALVRYIKDKVYNEMKENGTLPAGVKSSKDAFFPKVGAELCLPSQIELNGKTFDFVADGKVVAGTVDNKNKSYVYTQQSNPFTRMVDKTTYKAETCTGSQTFDSKEARNAYVEQYKKDNADKEIKVINK